MVIAADDILLTPDVRGSQHPQETGGQRRSLQPIRRCRTQGRGAPFRLQAAPRQALMQEIHSNIGHDLFAIAQMQATIPRKATDHRHLN